MSIVAEKLHIDLTNLKENYQEIEKSQSILHKCYILMESDYSISYTAKVSKRW